MVRDLAGTPFSILVFFWRSHAAKFVQFSLQNKIKIPALRGKCDQNRLTLKILAPGEEISLMA